MAAGLSPAPRSWLKFNPLKSLELEPNWYCSVKLGRHPQLTLMYMSRCVHVHVHYCVCNHMYSSFCVSVSPSVYLHVSLSLSISLSPHFLTGAAGLLGGLDKIVSAWNMASMQ